MLINKLNIILKYHNFTKLKMPLNVYVSFFQWSILSSILDKYSVGYECVNPPPVIQFANKYSS